MDLHRRFVALYRSGLVKLNVFSFVETALSLLCLRVVRVDSAGKVFLGLFQNILFRINTKQL